MSVGHGFKKQIGIGEQTSFGSKIAPSSYLEFHDESIVKEREQILSKGITGSAGVRRVVYGATNIGGDITFEVFPIGAIGTILKHAIGKVVSSSPDISDNPTVRQHIFTLQDTLPPHGLTFRIDRDIAVKDYYGCKINNLEITAAVNAILEAKITLIGKDVDAGAAMSPDYPNIASFVFTQGVLAIGSDIEVSNFVLTLNNNLREDRYAIKNDPTRQGIDRLNKREITGSFVLPYESDTYYNAFINGEPAVLSLTFESGVISGAYKYKLLIDIPVAYYQSFTPGTGGV